MVTWKYIQKKALAFPETHEEAHFEKTSFRVKKKIFATYDLSAQLLCVKLCEADQNIFSKLHPAAIYPVPNKWGKLGWTYVQSHLVQAVAMEDVLTCAYCEVAPKKLSEAFRPKEF